MKTHEEISNKKLKLNQTELLANNELISSKSFETLIRPNSNSTSSVTKYLKSVESASANLSIELSNWKNEKEKITEMDWLDLLSCGRSIIELYENVSVFYEDFKKAMININEFYELRYRLTPKNIFEQSSQTPE